jgi:hypothetical protein
MNHLLSAKFSTNLNITDLRANRLTVSILHKTPHTIFLLAIFYGKFSSNMVALGLFRDLSFDLNLDFFVNMLATLNPVKTLMALTENSA